MIRAVCPLSVGRFGHEILTWMPKLLLAVAQPRVRGQREFVSVSGEYDKDKCKTCPFVFVYVIL